MVEINATSQFLSVTFGVFIRHKKEKQGIPSGTAFEGILLL